jgi:uncharacterized membrane protein YbhN (UPF0104 family)
VRWEFLAIALAVHFARLLFRSFAWRTILAAAYPEEPPRYRSVFGAYVVGVGVNSIVPARAGDAIKLYLIKHRIPGSSYATLTPTLVAETLFDFFVGLGLMVWALSLGVLPAHEVYSRLPSVDWGFFVRNEKWTAIGLLTLLTAALIGLIVFLEEGEDFRARVGRGFAIMRDPSRLVTGVVLPQAISWVLRGASVYYFLRAFGVHASVHNALLAMVVDSLATLFPATPGGAGTKQGLIVFLFAGEAVSKAALLAFSVGLNIATVIFNLVVGGVALYMMARTLSWRRLRTAQAEEAAS